ncbi:hypothetical protein SVI_0404 [Shewanella violacea DSS12]|uniref:Uncharacterized protein n=1 Tax=Shewanella violacea (strain JCM 10179 / CIP 106290 / LMG 19151 / DSS12) TaxID=637905 RepID=D4ZEZ5_SHEVD|nr:hypothetical protein SVI_0404 [Shewanella violacea DSS12]
MLQTNKAGAYLDTIYRVNSPLFASSTSIFHFKL